MVSFYTICHLVFISKFKLKLSYTKQWFWKFPKQVSIFDLWPSFKPQLKVTCIRKVSLKTRKKWNIFFQPVRQKWVMTIFGFYFTYFMTRNRHRWSHEYVTHNVDFWASPPILLQKMVCVAPLISSLIIRPNILTKTETNSHGENIITSLSRWLLCALVLFLKSQNRTVELVH